MIMQTSIPTITAVLLLAAGGSTNATTVMVDWLVMQSGGTAAAFNLLDDANAVAANGGLTLNNGFAVTPASRIFAMESWISPPDVIDSVTEITTLNALQLRVAKDLGGLCNYSLEINVPSDQAFVVVVGGMLKDSTSATQTIGIEALSNSGTSAVTLHSMNTWSNGLIVLDQIPAWNPLTQILSTTTMPNGESEFVFFDVEPITGSNSRLRFSVPNGYTAGTGDSIFIGLGAVVPEPGSAWFLLLGAALIVGHRTRKGGQEAKS
jgi:hypothetical protein